MRINQPGSQSVQSSETTASRKAKSPRTPDSESNSISNTSSASGGANAAISSKARDMASAKAAATSAPDVREEKIAELRKRIQDGQYNVDPEAVADRMMKEHTQTAGIG